MYFSDTGYLYPYIHEESFMTTFYSINNNESKPAIPRTWFGLLNAIFAIATTTNVSTALTVNQRLERSELYHQRAVALCEKQVLRGTSIEIGESKPLLKVLSNDGNCLVQYLLLSGQYLQGTQKALEAWTVQGLAVRAAMQLGLHSSESSQFMSTLDREIRKRVWYGCVILDRQVYMLLRTSGMS